MPTIPSIKTCGKCLIAKPLDRFYKRKYREGATSTNCIACEQAYRKDHYIANKTKYLAKDRKNESLKKQELLNFLINYFADHPCVDCGEDDPVVLEFDHVKGEKITEVSVLINGCHSMDKILNEIAKCEVRCANCHRRKTAQQFNWRLLRLRLQ